MSHDFQWLQNRLENMFRWTPNRAMIGVTNYTRFLRCIQISTDPEGLSPTQAIDDVWHVHIINSPDYTKMCQEYFGQYIHHYIGHAAPGRNFKENYHRFLAFYHATFHHPLEEWSWSWKDLLCFPFRIEKNRRTILIQR